MLPEQILDGLIRENNPAELQSNNRLKQLAAAINELINHDFGKLVQALYRVDVSESTLKKMLQDRPTEDAGDLIARLLIERQIQKLVQREKWKSNQADIPDEEKW